MTVDIRELIATGSIPDVSEAIRLKRVSPIELADYCLERGRRVNPRSKAIISFCEDRAMRMARAAEERALAGNRLSEIDGLPITVKDLIQVAGVATTNGAGKSWRLPAGGSAKVVSNLERAGAVIIGKTNLHELAMGINNENPHFGSTRNPWNPERSPGGSSGGSAAAVALGVGVGSVGTDTGSSIRLPAAFCGICGLKPTHGLLSTQGVTPISWSLDHVGPMAARVEDISALFAAMRGGPDPMREQPGTPFAKGKRVGVPTSYFNERIDPAVASAYRSALAVLEGLGAVLVEIELPPMGEALSMEFSISKVEAFFVHRSRLPFHAEELGADVRDLLESSRDIPASVYVEALEKQVAFRAGIARLFDEIDVLAVPTSPVPAQRIGQQEVVIDGVGEPLFECVIRFTCPFNISGHPALTLPCADRVDGLPVGFQLVGPCNGEQRLLNLAFAYQKAALSGHLDQLAELRRGG